MKPYKYPTIEFLSEPTYIVFGQDYQINIYNDAPEDLVYSIIQIAKTTQIELCFISRNMTCPVCGKKLHKNGTDISFWDKSSLCQNTELLS